MGDIKLTYEPTEALRSRTTSTSGTTTTNTVTSFSLLSKSYSYSSSGALSHQPVPNHGFLQRSLTLAKPNHGRLTKIFKHFWTCVKPRILDGSDSRPPAAKEQKQGGKAPHDAGSTKRRSTRPVHSPQRVPTSPNSAMSPDVRDEFLKEAILYCNKSGESVD